MTALPYRVQSRSSFTTDKTPTRSSRSIEERGDEIKPLPVQGAIHNSGCAPRIQEPEYRRISPPFADKCAAVRVHAIEAKSGTGGKARKSLLCNFLDSGFWILDSLRFNKVESHPNGLAAAIESCIGPARLVSSDRWRFKIASHVHRVRTQRASAGNEMVGPPSIIRALHIVQGTPKRWVVRQWKPVQILITTRARGVSRGSIGCLAATCSIVSRSFIWR